MVGSDNVDGGIISKQNCEGCREDRRRLRSNAEWVVPSTEPWRTPEEE